MADDVIAVVNRSNQRGGRMLSLVDLIEAETLTFEQGAWLTERIEDGASLLVGANPGGAGKTAVLGALLTMLPPDEPVHVTRPGGDWRTAGPGDCLIAYEISPASFEAYIWGAEVRTFLERGRAGARLVANLHADTLEEAREQIAHDNGAGRDGFDAFDLFVPITVAGGFGRRSRVVERLHYRSVDGWAAVGRTPQLSARAQEIAGFLTRCSAEGTRRVEDVRQAWRRFRRR
jgi:hypothetical protein